MTFLKLKNNILSKFVVTLKKKYQKPNIEIFNNYELEFLSKYFQHITNIVPEKLTYCFNLTNNKLILSDGSIELIVSLKELYQFVGTL